MSKILANKHSPIRILLDAYPRLTREDIQAALAFAVDTVAHEETVPVAASRG